MMKKLYINIFIVDDNKLFTLTLKSHIENMFKGRPIRIYSYETGEECMEEFVNILPDLVILDYYLNSHSPGAADGLKVLDKIKKINFETSVVMLTSNDHINIALKSFHYGASDYVIKTNSQFKKINQSILKIFSEKERVFKNQEKSKLELESMISSRERLFQSEEKDKWTTELRIAHKELASLNEEKGLRTAELLLVNNQKAEVERSKQIIEDRNKDITDSINYARRIQEAKLPGTEKIQSAFANCFVLFKPKDIVSGDFYFFSRKGTSLIIAAADCTGHGVPGAFMSMIGYGKLEESVNLSSNTSEILKYLNNGIKEALQQPDSKETSRDGMDIAICSVDAVKRIVEFSGANRPLWIIRKNGSSVEEIKGNKNAIGGWTDKDQNFDHLKLKLMEGDTFYITTDGYADQFGGEFGKKLMTRRFKELLLEIKHLSMEEQRTHLNEYVESWRAGIEQVDDILVIGVRL